MAQIIKHRRGSLENLSSVTGSLQKGELVFATGSSNLTLTNGTALAFIVPESGSAVAANRFLRGANNPNVFSGSTYNGLLNGVPYYASGSSTLYLLGSDGNEAINLVGNIQPFSQSVDSRLDSLEASIGGGSDGIGTRVTNLESSQSYFDGTYSGSVATRFSASVATVTANSESAATSFSASLASQTALSASIATTNNTQSDNITIASQAAAGAFASASAYSGSFFTTIDTLSGSVATQFSSSTAAISSLSASVASVTGDFSSSVATSFSASAASVTVLSASIATTNNTQTDNITTATQAAAGAYASASAYSGSAATTYAILNGNNTFTGTQVITGSMYITSDLVVQGSSSLQNITASAVSIGTNTVILNTATPAVRFGGISVADSGSGAGASGSLFWDSVNNHWIYEHPVGSGEGYNSAILIAGPKNSGSLGSEATLTPGYLQVAVGEDHIGDSRMSQSADTITIDSKVKINDVSSSLTIEGNGFSQTYFTANGAIVLNPGYGGVEMVGSYKELRLDNIYAAVAISASSITGIGNVTDYSQSVDSRLDTIESSIGGGGSLGTRVANLETISGSYLAFTQSYYTDSASVATQFSASTADRTALSASIATTNNTQTDNITIATQAAAGAFASASAYSGSAASALDTLSGSIATTNNTQTDNITTATQAAAGAFASASAYSGSFYTTINTLSGSIATTNNTQTDNITIASQAAAGAFASASAYSGSAATALSTLSGSIATTNNTQTDNITIATQAAAGAFASASAYSGSAATALNTLSGSVYTQFSASLAGETALSSSLAGRVVTLEGSGSIQALGTKNDVTFNSVTTTNDVIVGGNLIVNGSTTSLNTAQLYVEDKLITLASGSTSSATSDGAGIEIAGTSASLKYVHTSTSFSSSVDIIANAVTASLNVPGGSSTKRLAFRGLTDNIEFIAAPTTAGDIAQWNGTDFVMSNTIDGGSF